MFRLKKFFNDTKNLVSLTLFLAMLASISLNSVLLTNVRDMSIEVKTVKEIVVKTSERVTICETDLTLVKEVKDSLVLANMRLIAELATRKNVKPKVILKKNTLGGALKGKYRGANVLTPALLIKYLDGNNVVYLHNGIYYDKLELNLDAINIVK